MGTTRPCIIGRLCCMKRPFRRAGGAAAGPDASGGFSMSLFATKSIDRIRAEAASGGEHGLKRVLSAADLTTLGHRRHHRHRHLRAHRPSGGAHTPARPSCCRWCWPASPARSPACATPSSRRRCPISGRRYTYGYATLGEFVAWIIGWDLILEYALGAATVAVGWSGYVISFLHDVGIQFPAAPQRRAGFGDHAGRRLGGHGRLQPAGRAHHRRCHRAARRRHPGVGAGQRRHRHRQGGGGASS